MFGFDERVLALACTLSSFAWLCPEFTWEPTPEGTHLNDYGIGSDIGALPIRNDWTVSRGPGNTMRNEDCVVILDEIEEINVAQFAAPEYMITTDFNGCDTASTTMTSSPLKRPKQTKTTITTPNSPQRMTTERPDT